jgi:ribose transport system substrate-binding protein
MSKITDFTMHRRGLLKLTAPAMLAALAPAAWAEGGKRFAYLTPGLDLPFWRYLSKGIADTAKAAGASSTTYDSHNSAQTQLQNAQDVISRGVDGIIISPTDSSTAPAVIAAAERAKIPVVIADIGTTSGDYVSFVTSNNGQGAYETGQALAQAIKAKGWQNGTFGLVTISLARKNGQLRTAGFRRAMAEIGMKEAQLSQMQTYTADETFRFVQDMLTAHPDMRALFVETDDPALGAARAIKAGRREGEILLAAFDGVPAFVQMLESGEITVAGMQQPYLMGVTCCQAMLDHLAGKTPQKNVLLPVEIVTSQNVKQLLPEITRTVFANEMG